MNNILTTNHVELSSKYNHIMNGCIGRDLTTTEEHKLLKVIDLYGSMFGVDRVTACNKMRTTK